MAKDKNRRIKSLRDNNLVIDNSYCGAGDIWKMPCLATRAVYVPKGTRLCQFRIQKKQPEIEFIEYDPSDEDTRGGFGSTGE